MSSTSQEMWDRVALLLVTRAEEGFEDLYNEFVRREIERLEVMESPVAGQSRRGESDGTDHREDSAYGCIIHER